MIGRERRPAYEAMVLSGIWLAIRLLWIIRKNQGGGAFDAGEHEWRHKAIAYMDQHGNQGVEARAYRRDRTFPPLPGNLP